MVKDERAMMVLLFVGATLAMLSPLAATPQSKSASDPPTLQQLYEAGRYLEIVEWVESMPDAEPAELLRTARSYERLEDHQAARIVYGGLMGRGKDDPWGLIAESVLYAKDGDRDAALTAALRARAMATSLPQAHYQLGMVQAHRQDFAAASESFVEAARLDQRDAYAHYYAGLGLYRLRQLSSMRRHLEIFLRLAPEAPERSRVESMLQFLQ